MKNTKRRDWLLPLYIDNKGFICTKSKESWQIIIERYILDSSVFLRKLKPTINTNI